MKDEGRQRLKCSEVIAFYWYRKSEAVAFLPVQKKRKRKKTNGSTDAGPHEASLKTLVYGVCVRPESKLRCSHRWTGGRIQCSATPRSSSDDFTCLSDISFTRMSARDLSHFVSFKGSKKKKGTNYGKDRTLSDYTTHNPDLGLFDDIFKPWVSQSRYVECVPFSTVAPGFARFLMAWTFDISAWGTVLEHRAAPSSIFFVKKRHIPCANYGPLKTQRMEKWNMELGSQRS